MSERVTFGAEVANALLHSGMAVRDKRGEPWFMSADGELKGLGAPYYLDEDTTLTSEQVTAAVGADPGRLAARKKGVGFLYARLGGKWGLWDGTQYVCTGMSPSDRPNRIWHLVYRPDLERAPEEPPRPAQGTTLRAIMEWCADSEIGVLCRRNSAIGAKACGFRISSNGDLAIDHQLSLEDIYESEDWQASTDNGKTWFVPGQVEQLQESGPKETVSLDFMDEPDLPRTTRVTSEAVLHAESGGVTECKDELFRVRDGAWECCGVGESSWSKGYGEWLLTIGTKYTLHPADHMDDAPKAEPREGPELWAWMCRTGRPVKGKVESRDVLMRVRKDGMIEIRIPSMSNIWRDGGLPIVPCTPAEGDWEDDS